jgi:phosphate starvation-inducible PhoH-like protein
MSKKRSRREKREEKRSRVATVAIPTPGRPHVVIAGPLEPKNEAQKRYINAIKSFNLVFGLGPAGTGKTYIAAAIAAQHLQNETVERIIITRPAVEAGESLGYLPGEKDEKYEPWIAPFREVLNERLGKTFVDYLLKHGKIEAAPFAYMRGRTFKNSFVILDEAQNATPTQMKLFLTRMGENARVVVNGDDSQTDLQGPSGLTDAVKRLGDRSCVKVVVFSKNDVIRSRLVGEIIEAYETSI